MSPSEFDALRKAAYRAKMQAEVSKKSAELYDDPLEKAKKIVQCSGCRAWTADPRRVWKDGIHLVDLCNPCFTARKNS